MFIQNFKEVWNPKEINKLNGFEQKSETPRSNDRSIWHRKRLETSHALSTTLFNIVLEKVIRNIENHINGTIFNRTRQYIVYVDDVLIVAQ